MLNSVKEAQENSFLFGDLNNTTKNQYLIVNWGGEPNPIDLCQESPSNPSC